MSEHTTHFDDCGCLAAQHAAEIVKALAERDAARAEAAALKAKLDQLTAGDEQGTWPCGCRHRIIDSWGMVEHIADENQCEFHLALKAEVARLREAVKAARQAALREVREWAEQEGEQDTDVVVDRHSLLAKLAEMEERP